MPDNNNTRISAPTHRHQTLVFDPACFLQHIEQLQEQFKIAVYSSFISALLITSIILKIAPGNAAVDWLILFTVITGIRVYTGLIRHGTRSTIIKASEWYGLFLAGCFICGGMWCYMGISLIPALALAQHDIIYLHAIDILFIAGLAAGTMMIYRNHLLPVMAFSLPAIVPYAIYLSTRDGIYLPVLGILFLMYFLFILLLGISHVHGSSGSIRPVTRQ